MVYFRSSLPVSGEVEAFFKCRSALLEGMTSRSTFRADLRFGRASSRIVFLKSVALHACINMSVLFLRDVMGRNPGVKNRVTPSSSNFFATVVLGVIILITLLAFGSLMTYVFGLQEEFLAMISAAISSAVLSVTYSASDFKVRVLKARMLGGITGVRFIVFRALLPSRLRINSA